MARALNERKRTPAEWLAWEERQPERWELIGDEPVMMAGGTLRHNAIAGNIYTALRERLRGGPCRPYIADVKARHPNQRWSYPDVVVRCGEQRDTDTVVDDAVVVVEVLSPGTESYDLQGKRWFYIGMPYLRHVLYVAQDQMFAELYSRAEDGTWNSVFFASTAPSIPITALDIDLPMAAIYEEIEFPPPETAEAEQPAAGA